MMTRGQFVEAVYQYCQRYPASSDSYHRTPLHNHNVGGKDGSPHVFWLADDLLYDDIRTYSDPNRIVFAHQLGLDIFHEDVPLHDHIQPLGWVNLPEDKEAQYKLELALSSHYEL